MELESIIYKSFIKITKLNNGSSVLAKGLGGCGGISHPPRR